MKKRSQHCSFYRGNAHPSREKPIQNRWVKWLTILAHLDLLAWPAEHALRFNGKGEHRQMVYEQCALVEGVSIKIWRENQTCHKLE